jgi:hypothetical protein
MPPRLLEFNASLASNLGTVRLLDGVLSYLAQFTSTSSSAVFRYSSHMYVSTCMVYAAPRRSEGEEGVREKRKWKIRTADS